MWTDIPVKDTPKTGQAIPRSPQENPLHESPRPHTLFVRIALLCILPILIAYCDAPLHRRAPRAERGVLDLIDWDFERDGSVALNGEWEFYPRQLLTSRDFAGPAQVRGGVLPVPFSWNGLAAAGVVMNGRDFGTYRLRILINARATDLSLRLGTLGTAFEIEADGRAAVRAGVVSSEEGRGVPDTRPGVFPVSLTRELIVRISNQHHHLGGFWEPILLGRSDDLARKWNREGSFELLIIGSLGVLCLYHLILFSLRRGEYSLLYFALFCFLLTLRAATTGHRLLREFTDMSWPILMRFELISIFLSVPVVAYFLMAIFPREVHRFIPRGLAAAGIFCTALTVGPMHLWSRSIYPFLGLIVCLTLYFFAVMILALWRRREGSIVFSAGFLILAAAVLRDILYTFEVIRSGDYLAPFGVLGFAFSQAVLLSGRLATSFQRAENLSADLAQTNRQLTTLKDTLEERVTERTHALEKARAEVESLAEVTRQINAMAHLDEILNHAFAYLRDSFQMDAVWLVMVDHEKQELRAYNGIIRAEFDTAERREFVSSMHMPLGPRVGTIWHVYQRRRPGYLYRVRERVVGDLDQASIDALGIKSVGYVPLVIVGKVIGILGYCTIERRRSLSRSRQRTIERFCDQIAGAIHNARLLGEAESAREKLAEVDRQKTAFFQNISHELRTPLTLIAGPLERASRNGKALDGQALETAAANTRRLQRLVNQLLDVQKISAGRMQLSKSPLRIGHMLETIHGAFLPYARGRGINLELKLGDGLPSLVADADQLEKCVFNYLSNALKFTPTGGTITLSAALKPGKDTGMPVENEAIVITVSDTGAGVAPDKRARLFERFGFSEGSLTRDQEGSGLGLSLVRELVEMHGGRVGVESRQGGGSSFWFALPISNETEISTRPVRPVLENLRAIEAVHNVAALELGGIGLQPAGAVVGDPAREGATAAGRDSHAVLIVEDNADLRSYMADIFRDAGYKTILASDGQEGLYAALERRPDLVVTDLMMPKMSGIDLIHRMRKSTPLRTLPIVLLTAKGDEETRRQVREAGADDFLAKPFSDLELLAVARNSIALKERERALLKDLARARDIQLHLLPAKLPSVPGIEVAAIYQPTELVGGDLYDFVDLPGGRLGVMIADVSGHGLPAAMIAAMLKLFVSLFAPTAESPARLLSSMNEMLHGRLANNFLTCLYVIVDPVAGRLTFARAGHPPLLVLRNGTADYHSCRGHAIGFKRTGIYEEVSLETAPGDTIILYTDGVTEVESGGELFEEERLAESALGASGLALGVQMNAILGRLREYQQGDQFADDVTLVGLRVI